MVEKLVFMSVEDGIATFEREDGNTITYPLKSVPSRYKAGDIIDSIIYCEGFIEFLRLNTSEMSRRRAIIRDKISRLRSRARRSTNA